MEKKKRSEEQIKAKSPILSHQCAEKGWGIPISVLGCVCKDPVQPATERQRERTRARARARVSGGAHTQSAFIPDYYSRPAVRGLVCVIRACVCISKANSVFSSLPSDIRTDKAIDNQNETIVIAIGAAYLYPSDGVPDRSIDR